MIDGMSEVLVKKCELMINQDLFALPRLSWSTEQSAHPDELLDEKRELNMIGFLLDAYPREADTCLRQGL